MTLRLPAWVKIRRHLHQFPELSGEERQTAAYIADDLQRSGLDIRTGIGGYGISAMLRGNHPGPLVAYRADMDALPIQDTLAREYAPFDLGIKHACGHDMHMTIALATAELLSEMRGELHGTVQFIFQPGEESLDGARRMLDTGLFDERVPQAVFALHAFPLPVGTIALRKGQCLAGMQEWRIRLNTPEANLGAVQSATIKAIQAISTVCLPEEPAAFDGLFAQMLQGPRFDEAQYVSAWEHGYASGDDWHVMVLASLTNFGAREQFQAQLTQVLTQVCMEHGATYKLNLAFETPPVINDAGLIDRVSSLAASILDEEHVWQFQTPYPFAHEDFALYGAYVPTAFIWLGTANREQGVASILHTSDYDIDEHAIGVGVELMAQILLDYASPTRD